MLVTKEGSSLERIEKARFEFEKNIGFDQFVGSHQMLTDKI